MREHERKLALAFQGLDTDTRGAFQEALERRREEVSQINYENQNQADAILEAEKESKLADIIPKLYPLWDRMERRKDQKNDLTLKEYQSLTGKQYPAHIIKDKQGREYVSWDNAVDNFAAEYGYDSPEDLYNDLEKLVIARQDAEGYRELAKMTDKSLKSIEANIKVLNKIKEGKYDNLETSGPTETGKPETLGNQATRGINNQPGRGEGTNAGTTANIERGQENAVITEVKRIFDQAAEKNLIVRTSAGHWERRDGKWHYLRDISPLPTSTPSTSRNSVYLSIAPSRIKPTIIVTSGKLPAAREPKYGVREPKRASGVDLGAGVIRDKRGQHVKIE